MSVLMVQDSLTRRGMLVRAVAGKERADISPGGSRKLNSVVEGHQTQTVKQRSTPFSKRTDSQIPIMLGSDQVTAEIEEI